jgi:uncharacterized protein YuzE
MKQTLNRFKLEVSADDADVAYVKLPGYPVNEKFETSRSVRLFELLGKYEGPDVVLDFDESGTLVGIELLA